MSVVGQRYKACPRLYVESVAAGWESSRISRLCAFSQHGYRSLDYNAVSCRSMPINADKPHLWPTKDREAKMRSLFPSTYDRADVLMSAGCSTFVSAALILVI